MFITEQLPTFDDLDYYYHCACLIACRGKVPYPLHDFMRVTRDYHLMMIGN
jgi:hypothetical protein